jgi:hypothetical protein
MKLIKVEIEADDRTLDSDLMGTSSVSVGQSFSMQGGAIVTYRGRTAETDLAVPQKIELTISFGPGVAYGLTAEWLFDRLKGRARTLTVNRSETQIEKDEIRRVFEETLRQDERSFSK